MSEEQVGSSVDDFLKEEGIFEEAQPQAIKGSGRLAARRGHEEFSAAAIVGRRVTIDLT